ncbi:MAG: BlaI/MecI/CopY family transcriptional regulator [Acidobacteria bacterium]|nr:BlaI/MecI/CopY family transcriptional regulator [Acidobacteriota bacterium]
MKLPRFTLRGFKRPSEVVAPELGPLERDVMEVVWQRHDRGGEVSVRDIHLAFNERLAYTTLMTTLDRLHKKGLLNRRKDGRAFYYSPRLSPADFERGIARDVIVALLGRSKGGAEPVLSYIVDALSDCDRELLDELDRLIKEKRRELRRKR